MAYPTQKRPRDMAISLLVLLVPLVLLVGGYQLLSGRTQPTVVDPVPAVAQARAAGLAAVEPTGLADGWVPVNAVFQPAGDGATLRIGYRTPSGASLQVVQSSVPADQLLPAELPDAGPPSGNVTIAGELWQVHHHQPGQALVRLAPDLTTIVKGGAVDAELHALAAAAAP